MGSQERPTLCRSEPPLLLPTADGPTPPEPLSALEFRRIGHLAQRSRIHPGLKPHMVAAVAFAPPGPPGAHLPPPGPAPTAPAPPAGPAFPNIPDDINGFIPESGIDSPVTDIVHPYIGEFPVPSAKMPEEKEFSPLDGATNVILEEKLASQLPELTEDQNIIISMAQDVFTGEATVDNPYKIKVQQQLTTATDPLDMDPNSEKIGYLDEFGYLVEWNKTKDKEGKDIMVTHARGEATYFTAISVVALASGNYRQDSWEAQNANTHISKFIDVLEHKSWGNMDEHGETHPIRHLAWVEYYGDGQMRNRPMSKDSFGQIVLACYYAYTCPNSSSQVRQQAQSLLNKWIKYLSRHQWRLHSNYIPKEFEASNKEFDNLFEDEKHKNKITSFGAETYSTFSLVGIAERACNALYEQPKEHWKYMSFLGESSLNWCSRRCTPTNVSRVSIQRKFCICLHMEVVLPPSTPIMDQL
ncbi:hypothetical protein OHC33_011049 [Knufia fluminis]|uniref:Uncharacterized protein n=1 Tax=Knufia fluminis TaxID=191047 RepID=A0AAN8I250_9EURO|nr:hypothetical protein OHC33_011049 [Knufia fluminis]